MTFKCPVYVQIYQHCVHFSPGTFCSHVPPEALVSYGNTLHISFSSNDKVVDTGFTASWKVVDPTEGKVGGKWGKKNLREKPSLTIRLFLSLPCGTRTHTHQLHVEAASAAARVKSGLLIGRATTKLSLCARGVSRFLQPKASMWPSPALSCRRPTSLKTVWTMWRSSMEKPCHPWVGNHDSAIFL